MQHNRAYATEWPHFWQLVEDIGVERVSVKKVKAHAGRKEVEDGLKEIDLCPMFDCLNSPDSDLVETASDLLNKLLNFSDPGLVLER